jgi:hypothetical protein
VDLFSIKAAVDQVRKDIEDTESSIHGALEAIGLQGPAGPAGPAGADSTVPGPQGPEGPPGPAGGGAGMPIPSASYAILNPGTVVGSTVGNAGTVYVSPIYIPAPLAITSIGVHSRTTAASSSLHLGIYTNSGSTFTRQLLFGAFDCSATSGSKTIAGTWTIPAGVVWIGWLFTGAVVQMTVTNTVPLVPGPHLLAAAQWGPNFFDSQPMMHSGPTSQASLPDSFTTAGSSASTPPIRVSALVA